MIRSVLLLFVLCVGTLQFAGCGRSATVDRPEGGEAADEAGYDAMTPEQQAEYDKQMSQEMGN